MTIDPQYSQQLQQAVAVQLPKVVPAADSARLDGLNASINSQTARINTLSIRRGREAAKYGASSSQVKVVDTHLIFATASATAVRSARERAVVTAPTLPPNSASVIGRVVGTDGTGIVGAQVEALDANLSSVKVATTTDGGAYQLILPVGAQGTPSTSVPVQNAGTVVTNVAAVRNVATVAVADGTTTVAGSTAVQAAGTGTSTSAANATTPPAASLTVTLSASAPGRTTLTGTEKLTLQAGTTVVRQLALLPLPVAPLPPPVLHLNG